MRSKLRAGGAARLLGSPGAPGARLAAVSTRTGTEPAAHPIAVEPAPERASGEQPPKADVSTMRQRAPGAKVVPLRRNGAPPVAAEPPPDAATGTHAKPPAATPAEATPTPTSTASPPHAPKAGEREPTGRQESPPVDPTMPNLERADRTPTAGMKLATASQQLKAVRPPILASESLREDMRPTEPGRGTLRIVSLATGFTGGLCAAILGNHYAIDLAVAALLFSIAALGALPVKYSTRAIAVGALSATGLALASYALIVGGVPGRSVFLAISLSVLAGGLVFRAHYRASRRARVCVALGVFLGVVWFVVTGAAGGLSTLDAAWQSWVPPVLHLVYGVLLMLSLLAFMGSSSTGASAVWAVGLLAWYALYVAEQLASGFWPAVRAAPSPSASIVAMSVASPFLTALTALSIAHLLAVSAGATSRRREHKSATSTAGD